MPVKHPYERHRHSSRPRRARPACGRRHHHRRVQRQRRRRQPDGHRRHVHDDHVVSFDAGRPPWRGSRRRWSGPASRSACRSPCSTKTSSASCTASSGGAPHGLHHQRRDPRDRPHDPGREPGRAGRHHGHLAVDCASRDVGRVCERVHDKIVARAGAWWRSPTRSRRSTASRSSTVGCRSRHRRGRGGRRTEAFVEVAHALDAAAAEIGIDFVGGFSALVQKGFTARDAALIEAIPQAIAETRRVCSSVNVASTRAGINMDAVVRMADVLLDVSRRTADTTRSAAPRSSSSATCPRTAPSWPARCTAAASPR